MTDSEVRKLPKGAVLLVPSGDTELNFSVLANEGDSPTFVCNEVEVGLILPKVSFDEFCSHCESIQRLA